MIKRNRIAIIGLGVSILLLLILLVKDAKSVYVQLGPQTVAAVIIQ